MNNIERRYKAGLHFYCGIADYDWNGAPIDPGGYACISPVYGRSEGSRRITPVGGLPSGIEVIQDSGAFSDSWSQRVTFEAALARQIEHAERFGYADKISHRASYDLLIDEVWDNGNRYKRRWSVEHAGEAVDITVAAARYLSSNSHGLNLILSAQGVDAQQYLDCTRRVVEYVNVDDWLGLGGWCIIGKMPRQMMPTFQETIMKVIPFAARAGIKHVHIWGVLYAPALGQLLWLCDQYELILSTDSVGPSTRPAFGNWGYADWCDWTYQRRDGLQRGLERARHVQATRDWLATFRQTKYYCPPLLQPKQLLLWETP